MNHLPIIPVPRLCLTISENVDRLLNSNSWVVFRQLIRASPKTRAQKRLTVLRRWINRAPRFVDMFRSCGQLRVTGRFRSISPSTAQSPPTPGTTHLTLSASQSLSHGASSPSQSNVFRRTRLGAIFAIIMDTHSSSRNLSR